MFIKVIDNFLTKSYHRDLLEILISSNFDWYYSDNVSYTKEEFISDFGSERGYSTHFSEYGFTHTFWDDKDGPRDTQCSHFIKPALYQIMDVANCDFVLRARADMVTWSREDFIHYPHIDSNVPNIASVFYVNESDGDTIFYNVKLDDIPKDLKDLKECDRVSPKANRLVIFDGDLLHTGCSPTKHKNRILINSNYIKKEYRDKEAEHARKLWKASIE